MKILNLFAGPGGNRELWDNCEVTAVELNVKIANDYRTKFPKDKMIIKDAYEFILYSHDEYDFVWASPPCTTHTRLRTTRHHYHDDRVLPDFRLYSLIVWLQRFRIRSWAIENVITYYEPMIEPTVILDKHYIWSNFSIPKKKFKKIKIQEKLGSSGKDGIERDRMNPLIGKYIFDCSKIKQANLEEVFA